LGRGANSCKRSEAVSVATPQALRSSAPTWPQASWSQHSGLSRCLSGSRSCRARRGIFASPDLCCRSRRHVDFEHAAHRAAAAVGASASVTIVASWHTCEVPERLLLRRLGLAISPGFLSGANEVIE
jgi:hypothetical protein